MKIKYLPLTLVLAVIIGFFAGIRVKEVPLVISADKQAMHSSSEQWQKVRALIKRYHPRGASADSLENLMLNALLRELDPYSKFIPLDSDLIYSGQLNGIGTHWGIRGVRQYDTLIVLEVDKGSPLAEMGVLPGHQILIKEENMLWYDDYGKAISVEIPRENSFQIQNCIAARAPAEDRLYIRILNFGPNTYRQFMEILETFPQARENLLIDLRGNTGGELKQALQIANQFIDNEDVVLVNMRLADNQEKSFKSSGKNFFKSGNIDVLIDDRTASSAEILAGILQKNTNARVIGRESRGKNELMKRFELQNGILHLNTGYYAIAGLDSFGNGKGIVPDIFVPSDSLAGHQFLSESRARILKKFSAYKSANGSGEITAEAYDRWMQNCSDVERLAWFESMSAHLDGETLYKLLKNYDPYFRVSQD